MVTFIAASVATSLATLACSLYGRPASRRRAASSLREAKIMQIFEGTNQIQRLVISRHLAS